MYCCDYAQLGVIMLMRQWQGYRYRYQTESTLVTPIMKVGMPRATRFAPQTPFGAPLVPWVVPPRGIPRIQCRAPARPRPCPFLRVQLSIGTFYFHKNQVPCRLEGASAASTRLSYRCLYRRRR